MLLKNNVALQCAMSTIIHPTNRKDATEIDAAIKRLRPLDAAQADRPQEQTAGPKNSQNLTKRLVKTIPLLGPFLRWCWSLVSVTRVRHDTFLAHQEIQNLSNQISLLRGDLRKIRIQGIQGPAHVPKEESSPRLPADVYLQLENALRGSETSIQENQAVYDSHADRAARLNLPMVDLGCGRGEWLTRLQRFPNPLIGIEQNDIMVRACKAKGLVVTQANMVDWLEAQPAESVGLITAFQVVEHLSTGALWAVLEHAHRALAPGGVFILETPNPENMQVASYSFWMDPTHKAPIPPPLLHNLAKIAGFQECEILRSSPYPEFQETAEYPALLHKMLFCEQDYALIARKT